MSNLSTPDNKAARQSGNHSGLLHIVMDRIWSFSPKKATALKGRVLFKGGTDNYLGQERGMTVGHDS